MGVNFTKIRKTLLANSSTTISSIGGLFLFRDLYSYGHYHLLFKFGTDLIDLSKRQFGYTLLSTDDEGNLIVKTSATQAIDIEILYQAINF